MFGRMAISLANTTLKTTGGWLGRNDTKLRRMRPSPNGGNDMESNEPKFKRVGLSSDGTVIFCEMDNGKTYSMPLSALDKAEDWNPKAKPKAIRIIHDGYAAVVEFDK